MMDFGRIWEEIWQDFERIWELGRNLKGIWIVGCGKVLKEFGRWRDMERILARSSKNLHSGGILKGFEMIGRMWTDLEGFWQEFERNW